MDNRAIGVFDSGVGGLTVLDDLINHFPHEDFIFLADTKNNPYGTKSKAELEEIVERNIKYFENENVKAIVIACNTATANSYHLHPQVPLIRIIEPTAKRALEVGKKILVLATDYTISSGIYQNFLGDKAIGVKCSKFVGIVEEGLMGTEIAQEVVRSHVEEYKGKVDTVILGCTHFGLLTKEIKDVLGNINIIDSSLSIAPLLKEAIKDNNQTGRGKVIINTTGNPNNLKISWFKKPIDEIKQVFIS